MPTPMGNTIPRHPCDGCLERSSLRSTANLIDAREQAIDNRTVELDAIKQSSLRNRMRKLGHTCSLVLDNSRDRDMIRTIEQYSDAITGEELDACPGLLSRDVVILADEEGDITTTEHLCSTRARLNHIDTDGWELPAQAPTEENRLDIPRDWDDN